MIYRSGPGMLGNDIYSSELFVEWRSPGQLRLPSLG
jgi:hypothetical protein